MKKNQKKEGNHPNSQALIHLTQTSRHHILHLTVKIEKGIERIGEEKVERTTEGKINIEVEVETSIEGTEGIRNQKKGKEAIRKVMPVAVIGGEDEMI